MNDAFDSIMKQLDMIDAQPPMTVSDLRPGDTLGAIDVSEFTPERACTVLRNMVRLLHQGKVIVGALRDSQFLHLVFRDPPARESMN